MSGRTELLEKSAAVLAGSVARLELARSYAAWGAALRRDNQRTRARAVLDEALDLAQLCGATGWPPRSAPSCGPPATDRERAP